MSYKGFKLEPLGCGRFNVYHPDGTLLIESANEGEAKDFVDAYTNPNVNW